MAQSLDTCTNLGDFSGTRVKSEYLAHLYGSSSRLIDNGSAPILLSSITLTMNVRLNSR